MVNFFKLLFLIFVLSVTSCTSQHKAISNYIVNAADSSAPKTINLPEPLIKKSDLLSIKVYSTSLDPRTDAPYNLPEAAGGSGGGSTSGFLVDENGNIDYPQLGRLHVEGLKKIQLAQLIKTKLEGLLTNPTVTIRYLNYRITILGEVRAPGAFTIPTERITILEAIGLAGDISEFGNKNTVTIAREKDGQIETGTIDLTSKNLFSSPYFRLQQNDVVFVEQNRRRTRQQEQQNVAQQIGIASSIITAIALLLNFIK